MKRLVLSSAIRSVSEELECHARLFVAKTLRLSLIVRPKMRLNPQLIDRLNNDTDIVAQYLAQCFVVLCRPGLATKRAAELRLNHREGALPEKSKRVLDIE